ncbi:MAG: DsbA family protein [Mycobacteriales bacterium]
MSQRKKRKKRRSPDASSAAKNSAKAGAARSDSSTPEETSSKPVRSPGQRWVGRDRIDEHRAAQRRRTVIYRSVIAVVIVLVAGTVGWVVYRNQLPSGLPDNKATPAANYAIPAGATREGVTVGKPDAPVTVDLYIDFQCPGCRDYERATSRYFDEQVQAGTVKLAYHPISILNGYSVWAASAAGCASEANAVPRFTAEVFSEGDKLTREQLVTVGKNAGLTSPQFAQCVRNSTYQDWALGVTQQALKADVNSTPTVMVNGTAVAQRGSLDQFIADTKRAVTEAATVATKTEQ